MTWIEGHRGIQPQSRLSKSIPGVGRGPTASPTDPSSFFCASLTFVVGWCSATESTRGFPVRVCLRNSPRTRSETAPKCPLCSSTPTAMARMPPEKSTTLLRSWVYSGLPLATRLWEARRSMRPKIWKTKKSTRG